MDSALELIQASQRDTGAPPSELLDKVRAFPEALPASVKLIGSYVIQGGDRPSVMIVETDDYSGLQHIQNHYAGWLQFEWHPTTTGGVSRDQ
jgi:hypothetical protein